jgi:hypothetical protein
MYSVKCDGKNERFPGVGIGHATEGLHSPEVAYFHYVFTIQGCAIAMKSQSFLSVLVVSLLTACSGTVAGTSSDAGPDVLTRDSALDVVTDASLSYCTLPNGTRCMRGTTCPAGDGCNTCSCDGPRPLATCTEIGCRPPPGECRSDADCTGGTRCSFNHPGCNLMGSCESPRECASLAEYCGCDEKTFRDCPGGITSQRYQFNGPCSVTTDAGTPARCEGASISLDGLSCVGPSDNTLPLECCRWNCDLSTASCNSLPPPCPPGLTRTVSSVSCWGPCVPPSACM